MSHSDLEALDFESSPSATYQPENTSSSKLPLEILQKIYENLIYDQENWERLCGVCKHAKYVVQLEVFKRVNLYSARPPEGKALSFKAFYDLLKKNMILAEYPKIITLNLDSAEFAEETHYVLQALSGHRVETVYLSAQIFWNDLSVQIKEAVYSLFRATSTLINAELKSVVDFPSGCLYSVKNLVLIESSIYHEPISSFTPRTFAVFKPALKSFPSMSGYSLGSLTHMKISWEYPFISRRNTWVDSPQEFEDPYIHLGSLLAHARSLSLLTVEHYVGHETADYRNIHHVKDFLRHIPSTEHRLSLEWRFRRAKESLVTQESIRDEIYPVISAMEILNELDVIAWQIQHFGDMGSMLIRHALEVGLLRKNNLCLRLDEIHWVDWSTFTQTNTYSFVRKNSRMQRTRHVHEEVCQVLDKNTWAQLFDNWTNESGWPLPPYFVHWKEKDINLSCMDYR